MASQYHQPVRQLPSITDTSRSGVGGRWIHRKLKKWELASDDFVIVKLHQIRETLNVKLDGCTADTALIVFTDKSDTEFKSVSFNILCAHQAACYGKHVWPGSCPWSWNGYSRDWQNPDVHRTLYWTLKDLIGINQPIMKLNHARYVLRV